jgi:hypothetical protein
MVSLTALWLPILLAAVFVFIASSIIHMVLRYHSSDFRKLPDEDRAMDVLRPLNIPPGEYVFPYAGSAKAMSDPAYQERYRQGPVAFVNVLPNELKGMGRSLVLWFLYSLLVGVFAAYLASHTVPAGAHYLTVFRIVGTAAFLGYAVALWQASIWYSRAWSTTLRNTIDGLIYALLTAGTFGWLWPAA